MQPPPSLCDGCGGIRQRGMVAEELGAPNHGYALSLYVQTTDCTQTSSLFISLPRRNGCSRLQSKLSSEAVMMSSLELFFAAEMEKPGINHVVAGKPLRYSDGIGPSISDARPSSYLAV